MRIFNLLFLCLYVNILFGLNSISFNIGNTTQNGRYICPDNDDCQILCNGNNVCGDTIFVCPNNYNCNIYCKNACQRSVIIAVNTTSLVLECRDSGCNDMVVNMTYGNNLTIFQPYIGIYNETQGMTGMIVYGEYLNSFSIECYMPESCNSVVFYLNYTNSINIIADSKSVNHTFTNHNDWIFRFSQVYAQNAGDIYFYCGWIGCIQSTPLIDASNANSLNLTCNGFFACTTNAIFCPNNGPRGGYTTNINIDYSQPYPLSYNAIYAVEQLNDVKFNCINNCDIDIKFRVNRLFCNPTYGSECFLTGNGTNIRCSTQNISSPPECSQYLLPTNMPTKTPSETPTISPSISPTIATAIPTIDPTVEPTVYPTIEPTTLNPTIIPSLIPTLTPTNFPFNDSNISTTLLMSNENMNEHFEWLVVSAILLFVSIVMCICCCIHMHVTNTTIETETKHAVDAITAYNTNTYTTKSATSLTSMETPIPSELPTLPATVPNDSNKPPNSNVNQMNIIPDYDGEIISGSNSSDTSDNMQIQYGNNSNIV